LWGGRFPGGGTPANTAVVTGFTTYNGTAFGPTEGTYCAKLEAGLGVDVNTIVSQAFTMTAGEVITGTAFFDGRDYFPFNDYAKATVFSGAVGTVVWSSNIAAVGDYGYTGWQTWSYTAASDGIYYIEYIVANAVDNVLPSRAYFDIPGVPIPGALWLMGSGLLGLLGLRRFDA
jgi:hypothetical protein